MSSIIYLIWVAAAFTLTTYAHNVSHQPKPKEPLYLPSTWYATLKKQLPPPPSPKSEVQQQDEAHLKQLQNERTTLDCQRANLEADVGLDNFFGSVLDPLDESTFTLLNSFFEQLRSDTDYYVFRLKKDFPRRRPFAYLRGVNPCGPKEITGSYPSGPATLAALTAKIWADLFPKKRQDLEARAKQIGFGQVLSGVSHGSDVSTGAKIGEMLYAELKNSHGFQQAFQILNKELAHRLEPEKELPFARVKLRLSKLREWAVNEKGEPRSPEAILSLLRKEEWIPQAPGRLKIMVLETPRPAFISEAADLLGGALASPQTLATAVNYQKHLNLTTDVPVEVIEAFEWQDLPERNRIIVLVPRFATRATVLLAAVTGLAARSRNTRPSLRENKWISGQEHWLTIQNTYSRETYSNAYADLVPWFDPKKGKSKQASLEKALEQYERVVSWYQTVASNFAAYPAMRFDVTRLLLDHSSELKLTPSDQVLLFRTNRPYSDRINQLNLSAFQIVTQLIKTYPSIPAPAQQRLKRLQAFEQDYAKKLTEKAQWEAKTLDRLK